MEAVQRDMTFRHGSPAASQLHCSRQCCTWKVTVKRMEGLVVSLTSALIYICLYIMDFDFVLKDPSGLVIFFYW